ncbi:MAG: serine/threonine protein kinase, partial [Actinomycetota bacterium]|nr:serine/threonine protein kinase [Actinomycetota bacterium]
MNQPGEPDAARRPPPPLPSVPGVEDLEPIGRGGYSVVYRGRQPELGRDVAVKVITAPGTVDPAADWWRREMTAMGRLSNHPNIVTAYASGMTGEGSPYLLLPYVPGGSLQDRLRREGPLSPDEAVSLGAKLASALSAAHAAGVLHRDVKPDNVLLSPYGEPQLTDFGIARLRDATTTAVGLVHATVAYAAPEVLAGEPATEVADVYGLAATLHTCLAGTPPFRSQEEDTLVALLARIATQPPPDLRALGVPSELAAVIEGGLAKDPGGRIGSADELRRLLEAAGQAPASVGDRRSPLALDPQEDEPPTSVVPVAPERASPPALPGRL